MAVIRLGILQLITGADDPYAIVTRLLGAAAPRSYLVIGHPASDVDAAAVRAAEDYRRQVAPMVHRSRAEVARFFAGLELEEPGVAFLDRHATYIRRAATPCPLWSAIWSPRWPLLLHLNWRFCVQRRRARRRKIALRPAVYRHGAILDRCQAGKF